MSESQWQVTVSHRVPLALAEWITTQANERGITRSAVLREALEAAKAKADSIETKEAA